MEHEGIATGQALHVSTHEHFVGWLWHQGYRKLSKKYAKDFKIDHSSVVVEP